MVIGLLVPLVAMVITAVYCCKLVATVILVGVLVVVFLVPASVECLRSVVGHCQG